MTVVRINDIDVGYTVEGRDDPDTPTIVWVGGTGVSGGVWRVHQTPAFSSDYRCVTYDLRGTGDSSAPEAEYTVPLFAEDAAALAEHLAIANAHWVGLSLGSAIIQELALARPELVRSAVLLSTWSSTRREEHIRRWYSARLKALEEAPLDVFKAFAFWMWSPRVIDFEPERTRQIEEIFAANSGQQPKHAWANHFRADLAHETQDRLGEISCPVLVLYGNDDLITLPWYNRAVAERIPDARCLEIDGAGHLAWLERPDEVNVEIRRFVDEVEGSG